MKKIFKLLIPVIICVIIAVCISNCVQDKKTLYKPDGETIAVSADEVNEYLSQGYYTEPVQLVYAPNGKTACIYTSQFNDYSNVGWFSQPPVKLLSPTGSTVYIEPSLFDEYLSKGYLEEPLVTLYSADGEQTVSVKQSETDAYIAQGYLTEPPEREGLSDLLTQLESYVMNRSGNWGVFVQDMQTNEYLTLHEQKYSGASLIKLFTMASVYNQIEAGALTKTPQIEDQLRQMITISSNSAFNFLTRQIGGGSPGKGFDVDNAFISSIGCTNTQHSSELIERDGYKAYYKGNNRTSPRDCGRILTMIYKGTLVSQDASAQMLDLLKNQTRTWKIPESLPEGVVVANKTGETSTVEADAAIVYSPGGDYVICIIGNGNVSSGTATIHEISRIVYNYFNS